MSFSQPVHEEYPVEKMEEEVEVVDKYQMPDGARIGGWIYEGRLSGWESGGGGGCGGRREDVEKYSNTLEFTDFK